MIYEQVVRDLVAHSTPDRARANEWFFKTGPGQYGEGDAFVGITLPSVRQIAKSYYKTITDRDVARLLKSPYHEYRLLALIILVYQFRKADAARQHAIYELYLRHIDCVNNWDLVDCSASQIIGEYVYSHPSELLVNFARSESLWERRIAIISTLAHLKRRDPAPTYQIATLLMNDRHDLIHKATGWALREAGKQVGEASLKSYLDLHYRHMPRTMLRYSLEKFSAEVRAHYMKKS